MTSPFTDASTRKFFETRRYFGLDPDQVSASQSCLLCWIFHRNFQQNSRIICKRSVSQICCAEPFLWQVTFFQQGTLPCVSADGRFIMETPYRVQSSSPLQTAFWQCVVRSHDIFFSCVCNLIYEFDSESSYWIQIFIFCNVFLYRVFFFSNSKLWHFSCLCCA